MNSKIDEASLQAALDVAAEAVNGLDKSPMERHRAAVKQQVTTLLGNREVKKPLFYESMTQAFDPHSGARIRVWRREEQLPQYNDTELQLLVSKIPGSASMQDVVDILSTVERVTAIELVDGQGNGAVVYLEW